jgi:Protein of unknown function (DUF2934)
MNAARTLTRQGTRSGPPAAPARVAEKSEVTHTSEIAKLAYRLYEDRGRRQGHDLEDWVEAERQLSGGRAAVNGAAR